MRIAIVTDAWFPQVNGVVRTLAATVAELDRRGYEVELITPQNFATMPMPGYASIRLAMAPRFTTRRMLGRFRPDIVHIATEGPIGWSARGWCKSHNIPFTSAFHTQFPKYAAVRTGFSEDVFWPVMRRFHRSKALSIFASSPVTSAGSGSPQCALSGAPMKTGQASPAALPQTVMARSMRGASGAVNSLQLFERMGVRSMPRRASKRSAPG